MPLEGRLKVFCSALQKLGRPGGKTQRGLEMLAGCPRAAAGPPQWSVSDPQMLKRQLQRYQRCVSLQDNRHLCTWDSVLCR